MNETSKSEIITKLKNDDITEIIKYISTELKEHEDKIKFYSFLAILTINKTLSEDKFIEISNYFFINTLKLTEVITSKNIINLLYDKDLHRSYKFMTVLYARTELEIKISHFISILHLSNKSSIFKIFTTRELTDLPVIIDYIKTQKSFQTIKTYIKSFNKMPLCIDINNKNIKGYTKEYIINEHMSNYREEVINRLILLSKYFGTYILQEAQCTVYSYNDVIEMKYQVLYKYYLKTVKKIKGYFKFINLLIKLFNKSNKLCLLLLDKNKDHNKLEIKPFDKIITIEQKEKTIFENKIYLKEILRNNTTNSEILTDSEIQETDINNTEDEDLNEDLDEENEDFIFNIEFTDKYLDDLDIDKI
jgi:hypothetical protein